MPEPGVNFIDVVIFISNIVNNVEVVCKRAIKFLIFGATLTVITAIITYLINPDLEGVMRGIEDKPSNQAIELTGFGKVWSYIVNNGFTVPLQMFLLSLIPVQFLYLINIIITVILPGVLFGVALQVNVKEGFGMILSSIPHYVFEIFAFCLLAAILFELNQVIRAKIKNIFKKGKVKVRISFIKKFLETVKIYTIFVLPLIVVAAFLETYLADILFNLFE